MEIILPHKGENLDTSMKNLRSEHVDKMESYASSYKVNISMPRMELRCETSLNSSLKALGMSDAFANNAIFSKISDNDLYVSDIHQTTFIKVDEDGTEAAAETVLQSPRMVVNLSSSVSLSAMAESNRLLVDFLTRLPKVPMPEVASEEEDERWRREFAKLWARLPKRVWGEEISKGLRVARSAAARRARTVSTS